MEVSGQLYAQAILSRGIDPHYPPDRRFSGLQSRSGRSGEEKEYPVPVGIETPVVHPGA
jgi:hypothetical protein